MNVPNAANLLGRDSKYTLYIRTNIFNRQRQGNIERKPKGIRSGSFGTLTKTLYLFVKSDLLTTLVPSVCFALFAALSGEALTTNEKPELLQVMARMPLVLLFISTNILIFCLSNQRLDSSLVEDRLNKPWRPIPAGLISSNEARKLLLGLIPFNIAISYWLGVLTETALQLTSTWAYNDLQGGEESFVVRNGIVAFGLGVCLEGALRVACGPIGKPNPDAISWVIVISVVFFITMQISDFHDMRGDEAKGRQTAPLVLGESNARWLTAAFVLASSVFCSLYWMLSTLSAALVLLAGCIIAYREIMVRGPEQDRKTWMIWAGWMVLLYAEPLLG